MIFKNEIQIKALPNLPNQPCRYAVLLGEHLGWKRAGTNCENLNSGQFREVVCFSANRVKATLVDAIILILLVRSLILNHHSS